MCQIYSEKISRAPTAALRLCAIIMTCTLHSAHPYPMSPLWRSSLHFFITFIVSYVFCCYGASETGNTLMYEEKSSKLFGSKMCQIYLVQNQSIPICCLDYIFLRLYTIVMSWASLSYVTIVGSSFFNSCNQRCFTVMAPVRQEIL
jgi:hypothetical protein